MAIVLQKFARVFVSKGARLHSHCSNNFFTTSACVFTTSTTPSTARRPSGYNAPTAFALFVKDQMKGQTGGVIELMKGISVEWKGLSEDGKRTYFENSKKLGDNLKEEFERLSDVKKNEITQRDTERLLKLRQIRKKRELQQFRMETNRPKKPLVSYMLFLKELMDKRSPPFASKEETTKFTVEAGEKWRNMAAEEKQPYVDTAKASLTAYHEQLADWEKTHATQIAEWKEAHAVKPKAPIKGGGKRAVTAGAAGKKDAAVKKTGSATKKVAAAAAGGEAAVKKAAKKPKAATAAKKVKKAQVKGAVD